MKTIIIATFVVASLFLSTASEATSRIHTLSRRAREVLQWDSFVTSDLLGGPAINMTSEPKEIVPGNCPLGCSGNGKCVGGQCLCLTGFVGAGCQTKHFQGYAMAFHSNSGYIDVPPLGAYKSFTMEAWVRTAKSPSTGDRPMQIFSAGDKVSVSVVSNGRLSFSVKKNLPETVVFDGQDSNLVPRKWYHVSITYSMRHAGRTGTGSTSLYLNGKWVQTLGYSLDSSSTNEIACGASKIGVDFEGIIDEFRLFSRALSPTELSHHSAGRLSGSEESLLLALRFDEGFGTKTMNHQVSSSVKSPPPHDARIVGKTAFVISYAPFEVCNLRCSDHGMCVVVLSNGGFDQHVCKCDQGYDGKECETQVCPGILSPCNAPRGRCQRTIMQNTPGWKAPVFPSSFLKSGVAAKNELARYSGTGKNYSAGLYTAESMKSAVDKAIDIVKRAEWDAAHEPAWKCVCEGLWTGASCEMRKCPGDCMGHGTCTGEGKCTCHEGWSGTMCNTKLCPNSCSGHGECTNGTCVCDAGFTGLDCGIMNQCPMGCSGHGRCVMAECQCEPAYTGDDCSWAASCYNFCSGRGKCIEGACACDKLYTGIDCSEPRCPQDCGGRGDCIRGVCMCEPGFDGPACENDIIWPLRCSTQRYGFSSSNSCKRGVESLQIFSQGAQVMQVKFDEDRKQSGAYQVFGDGL